MHVEDLCQEVIQMKKLAITKWWIWGLVVIVPGFVLMTSSALALVAHLQTLEQLSWTNLTPDVYSQQMSALIWLGVAFAVVGMAFQLVAWIGAVMNTRRLEDGRWFKALFLAGTAGILTAPLFGVGGLISGSAMVAYLVGGPDGSGNRQSAEIAQPSLVTKDAIKGWAAWAIAVAVAGTFLSILVSFLTGTGRPLQGHVWPALVLLTLGFTGIGAGVIVMTAAWWGAIFNTHLLADRSWFKVLLWSGIIGFATSPLFGVGALVGFGVLIAYVLAGPDGLATQQPPVSKPAAPPSSLVAAR
jgi:hypothetical protein